jgi:hypothetical protein
MRYRIGDHRYGMAEVLNLSGTPGNDQRTNQGAPAPAPGHREPVEISAPDGARLASYADQLLVHAAHRAQQERFARQRDSDPASYLAHLFGTNRGRA